MAKISKSKISVNDVDLKQAILKKNKSLKSSNSNLEKRIIEKEEEFKKAQSKLDSINKDYKKFYDETKLS